MAQQPQLSEGATGGDSSVAAAEFVVASLRDRIVQGELVPGTPLREVNIAEDLQVSRNTLREALRQLSIENLVELRRHRGAVVKVMTTADVRDTYRVRRALELYAVDESALATAESMELLNEAAVRVDQAGAQGRWRDAATTSLRFHQALVATLGSPRMDAFFATVVAQIRLAFAAVADESDFQSAFVSRDREICDLLVAGSRAAAGARLRRYLDDAEEMIIAVLGDS